MTSLPLVSGNTYLTSHLLVSVHCHGRVLDESRDEISPGVQAPFS